MSRLLRSVLILGLLALVALWWFARPTPIPESQLAGLTGEVKRGEMVFWASGCASCHMADGATGDAQLVLSGGQRFATQFGTFVAPNISNDPEHGIGAWTTAELASAVMRGVGREGEHLYPALPYASYNKMTLQDVADLRAFLATLPSDPTPSAPHELAFPFNIRATLGIWKLLNVSTAWTVADPLNPQETRGRYIAEAQAHCGECHTPRNLIGGMDRGLWLAGAPNPDGKGKTPNITPAKLSWSEADIVEYLTSGFTPEFDSVGGHMAHVVENMARLPEADRRAVAAYLKKVPPQP